jgi:hypothetical protein
MPGTFDTTLEEAARDPNAGRQLMPTGHNALIERE